MPNLLKDNILPKNKVDFVRFINQEHTVFKIFKNLVDTTDLN